MTKKEARTTIGVTAELREKVYAFKKAHGLKNASQVLEALFSRSRDGEIEVVEEESKDVSGGTGQG